MTKWDLDLASIEALSGLSIENGDNFVVKGGMATEAYLGGRQTRDHGDIDATYYVLNKNKFDFQKFANEVDEILNSDETPWKRYDVHPGKIEYRETEDEKEFLERRRLELYVRGDFDSAYETGEFEMRKLIDSKGNSIQVKVMELSELIAMKMRNIFMAENKIGEMGRPSFETDYGDLKKLLKLKEHDKNKTIEMISRILMRNLGQKLARMKAVREYDFVINLLQARRN